MHIRHETIYWHTYKVGDIRGYCSDGDRKGRLVIIGVESLPDTTGWCGGKQVSCPVQRISYEAVYED